MATDREATAFALILARASAASGIDFGGYRLAVMTRRVHHRAAATACDSLEDYLQRLDGEPDEVERLIDALLIKTTELFREPGTLELLRRALPDVIERRVAEGDSQLRAWVAGCSTGEEAFSVAAVLLSVTERLEHPVSVRVFGSDADPRALDRARRGVVLPKLVPSAVEDWAQRWFSPSPEGLVVAPAIRAITTFACHDLLDDAQPAPPDAVLASFDVISCRNVLIYLEEPHRRRVLDRLISAVDPGGLLMLGDAESAPLEETTGLLRLAPGVPLYCHAFGESQLS